MNFGIVSDFEFRISDLLKNMDLQNTPNNPNPPPPSTFTPGAGFTAAGFQQDAGQPVPSATVFTPEPPKKRPSVKSLALVGVLLLVLAGLTVSFGKIQTFLSKAEGGCTPENLREAEVTPNSAEITFQTGKACQVEINYGTSSESMLLRVPETMAALSHRVRLAPLLPATTYYYQVVVDGKKVGETRSFLTKTMQTSTEEPVVEPTTFLPVASPLPTVASGRYTLEDFQANFGLQNATFDIDKNGVVNIRDWLLYQKQGGS